MTDRPAWYDRQLIEYLPLVRRLVNSQTPKNPDDMIQDVMLEAVRKWPLYRSEYKFGTWMVLMVRNVISARKQLTRVKKRHAVLCSLDAGGIFNIGTPAPQNDYVELSETLRRLSGTRDSDVLMRIAMGDELSEIANDYGISRERVRQIGEQARTKLRRAAA